ncbi:hypothetical protein D9M72_648970 [compost metagenome]
MVVQQQVAHIEAALGVRAAVAQIRPGAEVAAGTGQHDRAHRPVFPDRADDVRHRRLDGSVERIPPVRPVQRDDGGCADLLQ